MQITSINNEKVKNWTKLKEKKYRDLTNSFFVEGNHLVNEALKTKQVKEILTLTEEVFEVQTYQVTPEILKKISTQKSGTNIIAICHKLPERELGNKILILDNIQDPGNLGTIIRSSVAFNIDTIVLSLDTVDIYNDKVIRSSEGMIFNLNIIKRDLQEFIPNLKTSGYQVWGTNVVKGSNINKIKLPEKYAIIMGNEGSGVKAELNELCDDYLYIKMNKKCESLNVGVATSIILYELNKMEEGFEDD